MNESQQTQRHSKHLYRALIALAVMAAVVLVARYALMPEGWGWYGGNYRAGVIDETMAIEPVHGPPWGCEPCHAEQAAHVKGGDHASVTCESCHAPLTSHVKGGERIAQMPLNRSYELCIRCHAQVQGRPAWFPQIKVGEHVSEMGGTMGPQVCLDCHVPHAPLEGLK